MFFLYSHLIHHNKSQIKLLNQYFPSLTQKKPLKNSHKKRPKSGFLFSLDHPYKKMYIQLCILFPIWSLCFTLVNGDASIGNKISITTLQRL